MFSLNNKFETLTFAECLLCFSEKVPLSSILTVDIVNATYGLKLSSPIHLAFSKKKVCPCC